MKGRSGTAFADDDEPLHGALARQLTERLLALELSQRQMAERLQLRQPDVSRLMTGQTNYFSVQRLIRCLRLLGCEIDLAVSAGHRAPQSGGGEISREMIAAAYQGAMERPPWGNFLRLLRLALDCTTAAISLRPARVETPPMTIWNSDDSQGGQKIHLSAGERGSSNPSDPLGYALRNPGDIFALDDILSGDELLKSEYYRTVMQPAGMKYLLGMCFGDPNGWTCQIGVMNGQGRANFTPRERLYLTGLRPHLEEALKIYAQTEQLQAERDIYEQTLNRLDVATLLLDQKFRVIKANEPALSTIESSGSLGLRGRTLQFQRRSHQADFERALQTTLERMRADPGGAFIETLRLEDPPNPTLNLLLRPASASRWNQSEIRPCLVVHIGMMDARHTIDWRAVARVLGLTRAEATLSSHLAEGDTLAIAARKMSVTESSGRTYLKSIFQKTGVKRQAELVTLILNSVARLS